MWQGGGTEACRIREHRQAGVAGGGGTEACRIREHRQAGAGVAGEQRHEG